MTNIRESRVLMTSDFRRIELSMPGDLDATIQGALAAALFEAVGLRAGTGRSDAVVAEHARTEGGGDPDLDPDPVP